MSAASARCGLFAPDIAAALSSATQQARGAALRAGVGRAALAATGCPGQGVDDALRISRSVDRGGPACARFRRLRRIDRMDFPATRPAGSRPGHERPNGQRLAPGANRGRPGVDGSSASTRRRTGEESRLTAGGRGAWAEGTPCPSPSGATRLVVREQLAEIPRESPSLGIPAAAAWPAVRRPARRSRASSSQAASSTSRRQTYLPEGGAAGGAVFRSPSPSASGPCKLRGLKIRAKP